MKFTCTDCHRPIAPGTAVIRSVSFRRVTYCQDCATDNGIVVPAQRSADEVDEIRWVS
jgi:RNase P subunit RPR2